jgi:GT2 family glycosyltransferase
MSQKPVNPLISIVIVNFNGKHFLHDCISALLCQDYTPFEIIMVDNASDDGSVDYVQQNFPDVKIFIKATNLGFAGGTNAGIREAKGMYLLTLNNDTVVFPGFIRELAQPMLSDPTVGMCASKMILPDGRINTTGICISRSGAAWDRGMHETDHGQYEFGGEVFGPCAGAALYRRAMLDETGLFDEDFFLFMEDVDLAFRARLAGWKCIYVPAARVIHMHGGSAQTGSDLAVYYGNRNIIWNVFKNYPWKLLLVSLPFVICRNAGVIPYYALKGQGRVIIRAKYDAVKGLRSMIKKRGGIKKKVADHEIARWIQTWGFMPSGVDIR